jgi:hypothetical protein
VGRGDNSLNLLYGANSLRSQEDLIQQATEALLDSFSGVSLELQKDVVNSFCAVLDTSPINKLSPKPLYRIQPYHSQTPLPKKMPSVIGIYGDPRSGKDVTADYLQAKYQKVKRTAFSDAILPEVNQFFTKLGSEHQIDAGNKSEQMYRKLLQAWGIARPDQDPDYWVKKVKQYVDQQLDSKQAELVIVTGIRLPPDIDFIRSLGGHVWKIYRPGNDYQADHQVENQLNEIVPDRLINNGIEGDLSFYESDIVRTVRSY